jgi:hypothetical protein
LNGSDKASQNQNFPTFVEAVARQKGLIPAITRVVLQHVPMKAVSWDLSSLSQGLEILPNHLCHLVNHLSFVFWHFSVKHLSFAFWHF